MDNSWDERGRAMEDGYFRQRDNEIVEKLRAKINSGGQTETAATVQTFNCPKCTGKLVTGNFENVQIDVCDNCGGVWLDAGELQQIAGHDQQQAGNWFSRLFD